MNAKEVLFSPIGRGRFYASRKNSPRGERTKTMDKIKLSESYRWCVTKQECVTRQECVTAQDKSGSALKNRFVTDSTGCVTGKNKTEHIQPIPVRL